MIYTCECCGISKEFATAKEAFDAGWDTPPYFSYAVTCTYCPSAFIVLGQSGKHDEVHKKWEREGRPETRKGPA